jgi:sugar/nucleoside kinase (ribokinase family)
MYESERPREMRKAMPTRPIDVIAAGHICLDVIPQLTSRHRRVEDVFTPGVLTQVGPATLALGGSVANTGLALHRLGAKARLVGKVGDDLLGKAILDSLSQVDASIAEGMIMSAADPTSYTIVLSPPNIDRGFLHCPGANDTFTAADLESVEWRDARIVHFGYPPLMRGTFTDEGMGLANEFARAQDSGALVSLDMATPHPDATNWRQWLRNVLPHVDIFMPSFDETLFMLDPLRDEREERVPNPLPPAANLSLLGGLAEELHGFGVPIVVIKLGDQGLYLSTSRTLAAQSERAAWQDFHWHNWENRRLLAPCFEVEVVGTTGSGDCTIAGFLWALLNSDLPEQALRWAPAVGAYCVESADATSNIPAWSQIESRLRSPWPQRRMAIPLPDWDYCNQRGLYVGTQTQQQRFV